jgi:glycerol-1-phosphate dehydrogenase [NAD(P)+]
LRQRLEEQLLTADQLRDMLRAAGCPTGPSDIGLKPAGIQGDVTAQMIRRRYTVLDLAKETGVLGECVDELFAPGGFWAAS